MSDEQRMQISGADIASVAAKLEAFGRQLPPHEQIVIDWLLQRAAAAPEENPAEAEVEGYLFNAGFSASPAIRSGLSSLSGDRSIILTGGFQNRFGQALGFSAAEGVGDVTIGTLVH